MRLRRRDSVRGFDCTRLEPSTHCASIELVAAAGDSPAHFEVRGLDPAELATFEKLDPDPRAATFSVVVAGVDGAPNLAGQYAVVDAALRFTPRYPLEPGLWYWATLERDRLTFDAENVRATLGIPPRAETPAASVTHIYPTADTLPENELKFYVHFSAPMSRGEAYRHIHLLRADGSEVEGAFLELGEELWDRDQRRFTLLCDPGRVKRGLKPREEFGPVLEEGQDFTLVVDADWPDADGNPLTAEARKSFHAGPPDDVPIDPATWKLEPPTAGTSEPLAVHFGEPLDHALAERLLSVVDADGRKLAGDVEIDEAETRWKFTPDKPWAAGDYRLVADTTLEDLAANAIGRAFDVDLFAPVGTKIESQTVALPFAVK